MYVENVVIGKPLVNPSEMFSLNEDDWVRSEEEKTFYTDERFLPKILVEIGVYPSTSEIRRNKPNLMITFNEPDFIELKVSKKRKIYVLIGE